MKIVLGEHSDVSVFVLFISAGKDNKKATTITNVTDAFPYFCPAFSKAYP